MAALMTRAAAVAVLLLACLVLLSPLGADARRSNHKVRLLVRAHAGGGADTDAETDAGDDGQIISACSRRFGGAGQVRRRGGSGWHRVEVDTEKEMEQVIKELEEDGLEVEHDQKRYRYRVPNDAGWSSIRAAMESIQAPQAWDLHTGAGGARPTVCVIDGGVNFNHPDLRANMHPKLGYDAIRNVEGESSMDLDGHGSHCAGTIAGVGNNSEGVAGVAWSGVQLLGCRFMDANGEGYDSDAIECLRWCRKQGAKIASNSWGGGGANRALHDEMQAYEDWGGLFVVASGNAGRDTDASPSYPGSYRLASVVHVNAVDARNDRPPRWTNYGANDTHLFAPGVSIYSTVLGSGYNAYDGTSMACPHVAGAAALLWSFNPGLTAAEIKALLLNNVDVLPQLQGKCKTGGRLNVYKALKFAASGQPIDLVPPPEVPDLPDYGAYSPPFDYSVFDDYDNFPPDGDYDGNQPPYGDYNENQPPYGDYDGSYPPYGDYDGNYPPYGDYHYFYSDYEYDYAERNDDDDWWFAGPLPCASMAGS